MLKQGAAKCRRDGWSPDPREEAAPAMLGEPECCPACCVGWIVGFGEYDGASPLQVVGEAVDLGESGTCRDDSNYLM